MIFTANKIRAYLHTLSFPVAITALEGDRVAVDATRQQFVKLIEADAIIGIGNWKRIKYFRLMIVTERLQAIIYAGEKEIEPFGAVAVARYQAERRARESNAVGCHSTEEWAQILKRFGDRCLRCSISSEQTAIGKLTKDHIVPLVAGGTDYASNLQPLCRRCNSWKGVRTIDFRPALHLEEPTRASAVA